MSAARYNLEHGDPSHGDHATLITNWVEERALRHTTGHTRHSELALEKQVDMQTFQRCVAHSDAQQRRSSLYKEEFKEHTIDPHMSKEFNNQRWDEDTRFAHHSKGIDPPRYTPNPYATTYSNSYQPMASANGSYFPNQQLTTQHPRLHVKRT